MQHTVPQFIERKPRIVGPLTFQQVVFIGAAAGIAFFLYFIVPLSTFIIAAICLLSFASAMAFLKIGKTPLPIVIKNLFIFLFNPKIYLWKRKIAPIKLIQKTEEIKKENESEKEKSVLEITGKSRLSELSKRIERKSK